MIKGHLHTLFGKQKQYQFCNKIKKKCVQLYLYKCQTLAKLNVLPLVYIVPQSSLRQFFSILQVTLKSTIMSWQ